MAAESCFGLYGVGFSRRLAALCSLKPAADRQSGPPLITIIVIAIFVFSLAPKPRRQSKHLSLVQQRGGGGGSYATDIETSFLTPLKGGPGRKQYT